MNRPMRGAVFSTPLLSSRCCESPGRIRRRRWSQDFQRKGGGAGLATWLGEPITPGFINGPAPLPHNSPPLAHFARRSGWEHRHFRSWSRRHFVSVEKEESVAAGSGRRSPVRRRRFTPEVPPVSSPNPPPRSACGEAGAARPGERKRSRKGGGVSRAASASAAADLGGGAAAQCQSRRRPRPVLRGPGRTPVGIISHHSKT